MMDKLAITDLRMLSRDDEGNFIWTAWISSGDIGVWEGKHVLLDKLRPYVFKIIRYKNYISSEGHEIFLGEPEDDNPDSVIHDAFVADGFAYKFYFRDSFMPSLKEIQSILFEGKKR